MLRCGGKKAETEVDDGKERKNEKGEIKERERVIEEDIKGGDRRREKGKENLVQSVFEKWDLNCAQIGEVTDGDRLKYFMNDELVADVPADVLVLGGGAPVYTREYKEPSYFAESKKFCKNFKVQDSY